MVWGEMVIVGIIGGVIGMVLGRIVVLVGIREWSLMGDGLVIVHGLNLFV